MNRGAARGVERGGGERGPGRRFAAVRRRRSGGFVGASVGRVLEFQRVERVEVLEDGPEQAEDRARFPRRLAQRFGVSLHLAQARLERVPLLLRRAEASGDGQNLRVARRSRGVALRGRGQGDARAALRRGARQGELRREVGARALVQLEAAQAVPRERLRGGQQRGEVRRQRPIARDRASARGRPGGGTRAAGRRRRGGPRRERARRRPRVRPGRRRGRERRHRANAAAERFLALLISADPRTNAQKRPRPSRRRAPRRRPARRAERGDGKEAVGARARGRRDRADRYEGARDGGSRRGAKATARSLPASD